MSKIPTIEVSEFISVEYQLAPTTLFLFRKRFIVAQLVKDCQPLWAIIISFKKSAGDHPNCEGSTKKGGDKRNSLDETPCDLTSSSQPLWLTPRSTSSLSRVWWTESITIDTRRPFLEWGSLYIYIYNLYLKYNYLSTWPTCRFFCFPHLQTWRLASQQPWNDYSLWRQKSLFCSVEYFPNFPMFSDLFVSLKSLQICLQVLHKRFLKE